MMMNGKIELQNVDCSSDCSSDSPKKRERAVEGEGRTKPDFGPKP